MTAEEMKLSMQRTWINNRWNKYIPTHFIVWCTWDFIKVNDLDIAVWATQSSDANLNGIHIEIVGDFNINKPTEIQYNMTRQIVSRILEKHPWMEIKRHWDFQPKNCPWVNFDIARLTKHNGTKLVISNKKWEILFSLSRYYSPLPFQKKYYNNKTYANDVCMNCGCWWDCSTTANWHKLISEDKYKSVACPSKYKLWTKIYLEWIGEVVCNDRWWAIIGNRLDMRCWYGDDALNNWTSCPTGIRKWYVIK